MRTSIFYVLVVFCTLKVYADEPEQASRPISKAKTVLAAYVEDHGLASRGGPKLIFGAWPDGHVVWSENRVRGGAPYRSGQADPRKVTALLARFEKDGLFDDRTLNRANFAPDSSFTTVLVKSGSKQLRMTSWHELIEESDKVVVTSQGAESLGSRSRLDILREQPADYLTYRLIWSEARNRFNDLIPDKSEASAGAPVMQAGVLSWQDAPAKP